MTYTRMPALAAPLAAALIAALCAQTSESMAAGLGERCGTIAGIGCSGNGWCEHDSNMCGVADVAGTCITVPEICMQVYLPVCGCDGKTYGNDCTRRSQKAQKRHDGPC